MDADLLITGGRVVAETAVLPRGYVVVRAGRIVSVGAGDPPASLPGVSRGAETVDATGLTVLPGLIDMHTHGIGDVDFMEADVEGMLRALHRYARFGVTGVVGSTLSNPIPNIIRQAALMRKAREDRQIGGLLLGTHVEGPWLAPRCRGGHAAEYLRSPVAAEVDRLLGEAGDVIRTVTYAPELPGSVELTERLAQRGIVPVLGHTEATFEQAEAAILAGARHVTHMYDTTLGYRENPDEALVMMPGMETAVLHHDEVSVELIACPVHVPEPFFSFLAKVKPRHRTVIVSDSLAGTGSPEGTVLTYADGHKVYVESGVLRMIDDDPKVNGNLTGSAVTLDVGLARLMKYTGLPVEEAVRWCSLNPATTLGIERETGSLRAGKRADIVLMDDRLSVRRTILAGRTVYAA
jgi:N-acetylglucosamine-6-phosphate deacetylase